MMDINMICATARRHNLGQIKPTPLAADQARSQLELLHQISCKHQSHVMPQKLIIIITYTCLVA